MAKFKVEFDGDTITKTLTFMGHEFTETWVPDSRGSRTLEASFDAQVQQKFPQIAGYELEQIEMLDSYDEDEMQDCLEELTIYESETQP